MRIYGYMRVSKKEVDRQSTDRQETALKEYAKINNFKYYQIVQDRISGTVKAENREAFNDLVKQLRENDILIVTDVDRLGRDADDVIMQFKQLKANGIKVIALDVPYLNEWNKVNDSSLYNMIADIFITLKAHMAQQEREKIVARINQGLAAAKEKGKRLGRPKVELPDNFIKEYRKFKDGKYGDMTAAGFAKMMGIARPTLYKYINICEHEQGN